MGFLICINLEHFGMAYAIELLCQDCYFNSPELSEERAGNGACFVDKLVIEHHIHMMFADAPSNGKCCSGFLLYFSLPPFLQAVTQFLETAF